MRLLFLLILFTFLLSGCGEKDGESASTSKLLPFPEAQKDSAEKVSRDQFAGSAACKSCHEAEYREWKGSTHAKAGGLPQEVKVIARFDGRPLRFKGATVTPRKKGNDYVFDVAVSGQPDQQLAVSAVVGGGHMLGGGTQSFFTKLDDGSYRFLPFDYIRDEKTWFVQLKTQQWVRITENIALDDLLNWPPRRMLGDVAGMSNCQNCHGSQIDVNLTKARNLDTHFTTLAINCESCHGPAKKHIELMNQPDAAELPDNGLQALETLSKDASLMICFQCHATKDMLQPNFLPGDNLESFYSLKMPILASEPFLPDGKVNAFAYQQNHLFSDCYINGSMTCVDCHSPHSQGYRDITGKTLSSPFDDGQCTGCHGNMAANPTAHSFHDAGPKGVRCTDCHMPYLQHRALGEQLRFSRSDHTIPIPRAGMEAKYGINNACLDCHKEQDPRWAEAETRRLWGKPKPLHPLIRGLIKSDSVSTRVDAAQLLLQPDKDHAIAQYTALVAFTKRYLVPNMGDLESDIIQDLKQLSQSADLDLQSLALVALHLTRGDKPATRKLLTEALTNAKEQENGLRRRWAITMDYLASPYLSRQDYTNAIAVYKKAYAIDPEDTFIINNLINSYVATENLTDAISLLEESLSRRPYDAELHFKLSNLYNRNDQTDKAIEQLEKGLKLDPDNRNQRSILEYLREKRGARSK